MATRKISPELEKFAEKVEAACKDISLRPACMVILYDHLKSDYLLLRYFLEGRQNKSKNFFYSNIKEVFHLNFGKIDKVPKFLKERALDKNPAFVAAGLLLYKMSQKREETKEEAKRWLKENYYKK